MLQVALRAKPQSSIARHSARAQINLRHGSESTYTERSAWAVSRNAARVGDYRGATCIDSMGATGKACESISRAPSKCTTGVNYGARLSEAISAGSVPTANVGVQAFGATVVSDSKVTAGIMGSTPCARGVRKIRACAASVVVLLQSQ